ncbi:hypothetical protein R80B4_03035 [Fibrobacteres bacterium R8-0-B4]
MDSGKRHDDEADIFDPAEAQSRPVSSEEHIETETNVFFVDTLRQAAQRGGTDSGSFEVSTSAAAASEASPSDGGADSHGDFEPLASKPTVTDTADDPLDPLDDIDDPLDDPLDDDFPQKKPGFFAKLFGRGARKNEAEEEDIDDLSLDDDMFIAPPPASERTPASVADQPPADNAVPEVTDSGVFEFNQPTDTDNAVSTESEEQVTVTTVTEVTDSGVFEFNPSADTDNAVHTESDEPAEAVVTVTEVTDSGVFEFNQPTDTDNAVSAESEEKVTVTTVTEVTDSGVFEFNQPTDTDNAGPAESEEQVTVTTVTEVTDSGVFEFNQPTDNDNAGPAESEEQVTVTTVTEVTDSGVFELGPSAENDKAVSTESDKPADTAPAPEVTDSGVFELQPPPAAPSDAHDGRKGDEWEIGWEPEDDGAAAEFDVSGSGEAQAQAQANAAAEPAPETPPPVFTKIAHVCLYVKDLGRSVDFYSKLGFQKRFVFNRNGRLFGAYMEFGDGNFIELFEDVSRSAVAALGRLAHFCLETPDIDAAMESLSARGIGFSPKKLGCDSTYQIWLKDPDGNEFEIHQYTENSSQIVGGEVEADW